MTDHATSCAKTVHSSVEMKMLANLQDDRRRMHFYVGRVDQIWAIANMCLCCNPAVSQSQAKTWYWNRQYIDNHKMHDRIDE